MTLSEIETILEDLALRHENLNEELLSTLLLSAAWEEKDIKDAVALFKQKKSISQAAKTSSTVSQPDTSYTISPSIAPENAPEKNSAKDIVQPVEEITFYQPDGTEEKELHILPETETPQREKNEPRVKTLASQEPVVVETPVIKNESTKETTAEIKEVHAPPQGESLLHKYKQVEELTGDRNVVTESIVVPRPNAVETIKKVETVNLPPQTPIFVDKEPQSLIKEEEVVSKRKQTALPEDLPLLPFENSPHIWSFSRYKNVFHGDEGKDTVKEDKKIPREEFIENTIIEEPKPVVVYKQGQVKEPIIEEDFIVEKTPLTKQDESLVFLAGIMLLVIILILGYMYSNGRL